MNNFGRKELAILVAFVFSVFLVTCLGVYQIALSYNADQERIRDVSFTIWQSYPYMNHGFLVFLSPDDFQSRVAYTGHTIFYSLYLYVIVKASLWLDIPHRLLGAYINSIIIALAINYTIKHYQRISGRLFTNHVGVFLAALVFFTTPFFWVSLTKYNFDNAMLICAGPLIILSLECSAGSSNRKVLFYSAISIALFSPLVLAMFGLAFTLYHMSGVFYEDVGVRRNIVFGAALMLSGIVFYELIYIYAKVLGFSSSSSGWLFRSGLDGSTTYFENSLQSVLAPVYPRRVLPLINVIVVSCYFCFVSRWHVIDAENIPKDYYWLLTSSYLATFIFWPQSLSIHPYLYDFFLMLPFYVFMILSSASFSLGWGRLSSWVLCCYLLVSNLTFIAQVGSEPRSRVDLPNRCSVSGSCKLLW